MNSPDISQFLETAVTARCFEFLLPQTFSASHSVEFLFHFPVSFQPQKIWNMAAEVSNELAKLSNKVQELSNELAEVSNELTKLSNELTKLSSGTEELSSKSAKLSSELAKLSNKLTKLSNELAEVLNTAAKLSLFNFRQLFGFRAYSISDINRTFNLSKFHKFLLLIVSIFSVYSFLAQTWETLGSNVPLLGVSGGKFNGWV